ncbi:tetratricopeptide repeat protein [Myroides odoratimimus]|uniref:tetratricopeptide repeat protein n=1 Tax=Myroides odoratimimus TaxID=76832 RepID=UPI002576B22E|nr:tetratricopeptide repeat protein [Myroides odoratimimus]
MNIIMHLLLVKLFIKDKLQLVVFLLFSIWCLVFNSTYAQSIENKYSYDDLEFSCPADDIEVERLYKIGLEALSSPKYYNIAGKVFFSLIERDKTLCDAYFFTGVALTKQDKHEAAVTYYYYADSLASKSNSVFKEELAEAALRVGNIGLARKKYEELIKDFPNDPDGYYGIGLTATSLGDIANGLQKLSIAEELYIAENTWTEQRQQEVYLMKGILFIADTQYEAGLEYLDKCQTTFNSLDDFNANYALASDELFKDTKDESYKAKALESLSRIKDKEKLNETFLKRFQDK